MAHVRGQVVTLVANMHKFHIPPLLEVVAEMNNLGFRAVNADNVPGVLGLEKINFLAKIAQNLLINKLHEPVMIARIEKDLQYFATTLLKDCSDSITPIASELLSCIHRGIKTGDEIKATLELLREKKYPMLHLYEEQGKEAPQERKYLTWCMRMLVGMRRSDRQRVVAALSTENGHSVPSLYTLSKVSKIIFMAEKIVFRQSQDIYFNTYFNLLVFWTTCISMYHEVFSNELLNDNICYMMALVKKEARELFSWYDLRLPNVASQHLVKYLEHLIRRLGSEINDLVLSEIIALSFHCKMELSNLE